MEFDLGGGIYTYNFWSFDPLNESYVHLNKYPGDSYDPRDSPTQAVVFQDKLHFFPGFQHWVYDPIGGDWLKFSDIGPKRTNSSEFKAFSYKNELYGVSLIYERIDDRSTTTARVLKYNAANDTWVRDADVPFTGCIESLYVLNLDEDHVFLAVECATMSFYEIQ